MEYDVVVIGGGPGGYVAAIKASQLGLKTACVEFDEDNSGKIKLGGTCLNVGCIPSKSLLDSSYKFQQISESFNDHGIKVSKPTYDLSKMMQRKDEIVTKLTGGVAHLFKHNKVESIHGKGKLISANEVEVTKSKGKKQVLKAKNIHSKLDLSAAFWMIFCAEFGKIIGLNAYRLYVWFWRSI